MSVPGKAVVMHRVSRLIIPLFAIGYILSCLHVAPTRAHSSSPVSGQGQSQTEPAAPGPKDLDDEKLNLSQDQKNQIKQFRKDEKSQIDAVRNDSSLTPEQKEKKIRQIRRDTHKQVLGVLTPEQRKIVKERQRETRAARRGRYHRRAP
jgi:Spy/CpxP family protein refolding chaperone